MRSLALAAILLTGTSQAQFQIQDSHTTASLRGIHSISNGVAWASGTEGTILRTTDEGTTWQRCTTPPDAEKLDFRGIQAFDQNTAIVMSSGKGDLSRLYKTSDACKSWKLVFINPDKEGFWDAIRLTSNKTAIVVGDPVEGQLYFWHLSIRRQPPSFPIYGTWNSGESWHRLDSGTLYAMRDKNHKPAQSIFAASNSSLLDLKAHSDIVFVTGGQPNGLEVLRYSEEGFPLLVEHSFMMTGGADTKLAQGPTAGGFSISVDSDTQRPNLNVVGGDYTLPDKREGTASTCHFGSPANLVERLTFYMCEPAQTPPHGYRSAVAYDATTKTWITVGPNGTDISRDDGRNWTALKPTAQDTPDADKNWNALSLPFVVGPKGRIGKLRPEALKP